MKRIAASFLLIFLCRVTGAQEVPPIASGTPVRVSSPIYVTFQTFTQASTFEGVVIKMDSDTLVMKAKGWGVPVSIPLTATKSLEISREKKSVLFQGILIGAWVGSMIGAEIFLNNDSASASRGPALEVFSAGVASGLVGTLLGSLIKIKKWEAIPLNRFGSVDSPGRDQRTAALVSMSLSFEQIWSSSCLNPPFESYC